MTEEENEAIETLQYLCSDDCISKDIIKTIVKLIEKLQKENEQLNNRDTSRLSEIGKLRAKNNHLENEIKYYCIPKDKISELIKEPTIITSDDDYISVKKVKKLLEEE